MLKKVLLILYDPDSKSHLQPAGHNSNCTWRGTFKIVTLVFWVKCGMLFVLGIWYCHQGKDTAAGKSAGFWPKCLKLTDVLLHLHPSPRSQPRRTNQPPKSTSLHIWTNHLSVQAARITFKTSSWTDQKVFIYFLLATECCPKLFFLQKEGKQFKVK